MKKIDIQTELLSQKREVLKNLKATQSYYKEGMDLDEGTNIDPEDFSHQNEWQDMARKLDVRIAETNHNISILEKLSTDSNQTAVPGALVRLKDSKSWLYLGAVFPTTQAKGVSIMGVSTKAPIFQSLSGLKAGDSFDWRGKKMTIAEII